MATRQQVKKLGFVTDIRETRLQRLLTEAVIALECATAELRTAEQWLTRRQHELEEATCDFARCPQNETVRIWYDLCRQRLISARNSLEAAHIDREEALAQLAAAQRDVRKIQERGKHIAKMSRSLRNDEVRRSESKADDEFSVKPIPSILVQSG